MSKKKVYIIDDEVSFRTMIETLLEVHGFNVVSESTPKNAIPDMIAENPDVVVLDMNMPIITGIELFQQMKQEPDLKDIPVILLTGDGKISTKQDAIEVGINWVFLKTETQPKELIGKIKTLCS